MRAMVAGSGAVVLRVGAQLSPVHPAGPVGAESPCTPPLEFEEVWPCVVSSGSSEEELFPFSIETV